MGPGGVAVSRGIRVGPTSDRVRSPFHPRVAEACFERRFQLRPEQRCCIVVSLDSWSPVTANSAVSHLSRTSDPNYRLHMASVRPPIDARGRIPRRAMPGPADRSDATRRTSMTAADHSRVAKSVSPSFPTVNMRKPSSPTPNQRFFASTRERISPTILAWNSG